MRNSYNAYGLKTYLDPKSRLGNIGAFRAGFIERISRNSRISPHPKKSKEFSEKKKSICKI